MRTFHVLKDHKHVGTAYAFYQQEFSLNVPLLFDTNGEPLPPAWYELVMIDEVPCVIAKGKH